MTLEEDLLKQGFKAFGPFSFQEALKHVDSVFSPQREELAEIRVVHGQRAREDMQEYRNLWMIYVLDNSRVPVQATEYRK